MENRDNVLSKAYLEYYDLLFKSAYSRLKTVMDAEDAVQDTFERALKFWHTYDPKKSAIQTWLNNILHNRCNAIQTLERNRGMSVSLDEELLDGVGMDDAEKQILVSKLMAEIGKERNPTTRAILQLYFGDRAKPAEIVGVVGKPQQQISNIIQVFKNTMKARFGE